MNEILKTELFSLLTETSLVANDQIGNAYGDFMKQTRAVSQSEQDYSRVFRILNTTRIELAFLKSLYRYELGEKCPKICLYSKGFSPCQF